MLIRILALGVTLLLTLQAASAGNLSADDYLALRKTLGAITDIAKAKADPASCIGRAVELAGRVNGVARCGNSASFILDAAHESYMVTAAQLPDCIANGNAVRVLARVGKASVASLCDLVLEGAAYEYDVSAKEKKLAAEAKPVKKESKPGVVKKASRTTPPRSTRIVNLSSRAMKIFDPYKAAIKRFNPKLSDKDAETIAASVLAFSEHYGVDPRLIVAVILAESHFRPEATSRAGAMGLGQLMPGTAAGLGVRNPYDPVQNIAGCVRLIRGHLDRQGDLALALAAYNAGPGAVRKYGGVPPYRETQNYIRRVAAYYNALCGRPRS